MIFYEAFLILFAILTFELMNPKNGLPIFGSSSLEKKAITSNTTLFFCLKLAQPSAIHLVSAHSSVVKYRNFLPPE